jgi:hypothetical protein
LGAVRVLALTWPADVVEGWDGAPVDWLDGAGVVAVPWLGALELCEKPCAGFPVVDPLPFVVVPTVLVVTQSAVTLLTEVPGGSMSAGGVPGGALTVKVSVVPLRSVAVTLQGSADAAGGRADPRARATRAAAVSDNRGFRHIKGFIPLDADGTAKHPENGRPSFHRDKPRRGFANHAAGSARPLAGLGV